MNQTIRVNGQRLWDSLMNMAEIGATAKGGSCRLALTEEDRLGRNLFVNWCKKIGCSIKIDDMGNIFAQRKGLDNTRLPVAMGSHLDTQPSGGKFDGVYGVLAGLEVLRTLHENDITTNAPIEVVVWTNEEGSRFAPAMISSGVYAGLFSKEYGWSRTDADGNTLLGALEQIGYRGNEACGYHKMGAFLEAHIEQGPILEKNECVIGVVTGAQGQRWFDVIVTGQESHAGTTPMDVRQDALVASSRMISAIRDLALEFSPHAVTTIGALSVSPNSRNTIVGQVAFTIDIRHPDNDTVSEIADRIEKRCASIADEEKVSADLDLIWVKPKAEFATECINAVQSSAELLNYSHQQIVSGAGHDACQVCEIVPTGMIFVPCANGLSHNEEESAEPEDLEAGCNVLLHAALQLAG